MDVRRFVSAGRVASYAYVFAYLCDHPSGNEEVEETGTTGHQPGLFPITERGEGGGIAEARHAATAKG